MPTKRAKSYEELTSEEQAKVDAFRAKRSTPEYRDQEQRVREQAMEEFPPKLAPELIETLAALRLERERQGLSLAEISQRSGMERSAIQKLETGQTNPTVATLQRYAAALGKRFRWELVAAVNP